jgi:transposase-like protein
MQQPVPVQPQNAPCPKCGSTNAQKVGYTWWGGALGPAIFHHVKCNQCGATYNGKTGKSNVTAIIIYSVVIFVVCIVFYAIVQGM